MRPQHGRIVRRDSARPGPVRACTTSHAPTGTRTPPTDGLLGQFAVARAALRAPPWRSCDAWWPIPSSSRAGERRRVRWPTRPNCAPRTPPSAYMRGDIDRDEARAGHARRLDVPKARGVQTTGGVQMTGRSQVVRNGSTTRSSTSRSRRRIAPATHPPRRTPCVAPLRGNMRFPGTSHRGDRI